MLKLFRYEGFRVIISEEALTLKPFRVLWDRDKTKNKDKATLELAFIYFYSDPRSDYHIYRDLEERKDKIIEDLGLGNKWKIDKQVQTALEFYDSFKPMSVLLLEDVRDAINNLRSFLKGVDLNERDDKGKPVFASNTISQGLNQCLTLIDSLSKVEARVKSDITETTRVRGNKEMSILDNEQ